MAKCLKCKCEIPDGVQFCTRCGSTLIEQETVAFRPGMPKTVKLVRLGTPAAEAAAPAAGGAAPHTRERGAGAPTVPSGVPGMGATNTGIGWEIEREEARLRLEKELEQERAARADAVEELDSVKHEAALRDKANENIREQVARAKKIGKYAVPATGGLLLLLVILTLTGFSGKSKASRELAELRSLRDKYDKAVIAYKNLSAEHDALQLQIVELNERIDAMSAAGNGARTAGAHHAQAAVNILMIPVRGGSFKMGCTPEQGSDCDEDEFPVHTVSVSGFSIGKYPVTQAQWRQVMGTNPSKFRGYDRPVEQVSWRDAQEFIKRLNQMTGRRYRLPTEAEWEFAARGGTNSRGYKYSGSNRVEEAAWYSRSSGTGDVGARLPNELGIHDMSGNVYEWVSDRYGGYSGQELSNPAGPASGNDRVLRGGSWSNGAAKCRVAERTGMPSGTRGNYIGFRLAHND